jgi:D-alanine-D-alanine ligase
MTLSINSKHERRKVVLRRKRVAVIYGGISTEHEVSIASAKNIMAALMKRHHVVPIYITKEGRWLTRETVPEDIHAPWWEYSWHPVLLNLNREEPGLYRVFNGVMDKIPADIVFPVLHGRGGEDGTIQGLLEVSGLPYVGCGVAASAVGMDKVFTKLIVSNIGIPQADYLVVTANELEDRSDWFIEQVSERLGYPCFVKPANAGSSIGISKAGNATELISALKIATAHDKKIIVERGIIGRELECAVLGNGEPKVSGIGEIITGEAFYDYDAKYASARSCTVVPAGLKDTIAGEIRRSAAAIFKACECSGLARVDFFLEKKTNRVIFNEINTLPGFTDKSMYPALWESEGLSLDEVCDSMMEYALERFPQGKEDA